MSKQTAEHLCKHVGPLGKRSTCFLEAAFWRTRSPRWLSNARRENIERVNFMLLARVNIGTSLRHQLHHDDTPGDYPNNSFDFVL